MSIDTISYSPGKKGWVTRWSWIPDWMIGLNSSLYTFKNGSLYKHDSNATYNEFYGSQDTSTIKFAFNNSPYEEKMFKTLSLDSNVAWTADIATDSSNGEIDQDWYTLKEGEYHAWIRRDANTIDVKALSTQGVGTILSYAALTLTFGFNISAPVSSGDKLYIMDINTGTLDLIGNVTTHTTTTITVDAAANVPGSSDFIVLVKDSTAESYGARGSYMTVELTADEDTAVELFSVGSDVFKSYQ